MFAAEPPPPPVTIERVARSRPGLVVTDTRLRACAGDRCVVLARGSAREPARGKVSGTYIGAAAVSGRRVVWVKARAGRRWTVARLHVVRVGERRVRRPETRRIFRLRTRGEFPVLDAVVTSRGELAWLAPHGDDVRVVARRPGRRPRTLGRYDFFALALEDDRTLRLRHGGGFRYFDLRPGREPSCGGRERFEPIFESTELVVTQAAYSNGDDDDLAIRVCRRSTGRDPVVDSLFGIWPDSAWFDVIGADRDWALIVERSARRLDDSAVVRAYRAGSGQRGPAKLYEDYLPEWWLPEPGAPMAVSEAGVPAWVSVVDGVARLLAIPRNGVHRVLDTGGTLAGLAFDGTTLQWTHDGEPRSAIP